uniref:Uncharacterized protein n=1 Tax=Rhizophora mucronata TaxID=61149 RepID=A0A2P2NZ68_RHIMU
MSIIAQRFQKQSRFFACFCERMKHKAPLSSNIFKRDGIEGRNSHQSSMLELLNQSNKSKFNFSYHPLHQSMSTK